MAIVNVTGTFISASLKTSNFEGKTSYSVQLDIYQEASPQSDKMVTIKVEDAQQLAAFQNKFKMGDKISVDCTISAYKNQAYYKLLDVVPIAS